MCRQHADVWSHPVNIPYKTHPTIFTRMIDTHPCRSMLMGSSISGIRLFETLTLQFQAQYHGYGQRARSNNRPAIQYICFRKSLLQSDQQITRYSYFNIWPWKNPRWKTKVTCFTACAVVYTYQTWWYAVIHVALIPDVHTHYEESPQALTLLLGHWLRTYKIYLLMKLPSSRDEVPWLPRLTGN